MTQRRNGRENRIAILKYLESRSKEPDEVLDGCGIVRSPTLGEIATSVGISKPTVQYHLGVLRDKGWIVWVPKDPRSIRLTKSGEQFLAIHNASKKE